VSPPPTDRLGYRLLHRIRDRCRSHQAERRLKLDADLGDGLAGGRILAQSGNDREDDLAIAARHGDGDLPHSGGTHEGRDLRGAAHRHAVDAHDPVARREAGRLGGGVRSHGRDNRRVRRIDAGNTHRVGSLRADRDGEVTRRPLSFDSEDDLLVRPDDDGFHRRPPVGNRLAGDGHDPVPGANSRDVGRRAFGHVGDDGGIGQADPPFHADIEEPRQDRHRQHEVHGGAGEENGEPFPAGPVLEFGGVVAPVTGRVSRHLDVAAEGQEADRPLGIPDPSAVDVRREADRKRLDPHADETRHQVVAELVHDDEGSHHEHEGNEGDHGQRAVAGARSSTSSSA